jgi:ribosomal protein S12 methylthiotransferase
LSVVKSGPRVHLISLGCAKNLVDSERLLARLASAGATVGAPRDEADVIIVNTCGFIGPAKKESIDAILEAAGYKEEAACRKLLVMGCLVERHGRELRAEIPEVDAFFGLHAHDAIAAACGLSSKDDGARLLLTPPHTAYLRISEGCDHHCSYCTIPAIRGPFRSRNPAEVIREAEQLVASGVRELNLIGQDTTLYGVDLRTSFPIQALIARLAEIRELRWLRLLYTHPAHVSDELIEAYAAIPKLCPYVDLPLQHLDDQILQQMGRQVTRAHCLDLIARLRARGPKMAVRTTFIVGFPGETRAQFNELLRLVRELRFDSLGAFAYSREEGTRAARMRRQIPEQTKQQRLEALMLTQQAVAFETNRSRVGQPVEVVIDAATENDGVWIGRTITQAPDVDSVTLVHGDSLRPGQFVDARIVDVDGYDLIANAE